VAAVQESVILGGQIYPATVIPGPTPIVSVLYRADYLFLNGSLLQSFGTSSRHVLDPWTGARDDGLDTRLNGIEAIVPTRCRRLP
jgi:hypothetical protein